MIKLLIPVRINCRTASKFALEWKAYSKPCLFLAQVFGHSTDNVQSSQGTCNSLFIQPVPSRQDCHAAQPQPLCTLPLAVSTSRAMEIHGSLDFSAFSSWIRWFLCFASIWLLVTPWSWIPAKIGASTLLQHRVVPFCDKFNRRDAALLFPGTLGMGNKMS